MVYQNILEGLLIKGIMATRNAPSTKRSGKGLPSPEDDPNEIQEVSLKQS
jgi:hypothetical protein